MAEPDVARWRQLAEAATAGPITVEHYPNLHNVEWLLHGAGQHTFAWIPACDHHAGQTERDADFLQIAREAVLGLAAEVDRLQAELARMSSVPELRRTPRA